MRTKDIKTFLVIVRKFTGKYQILQTDYLNDKTVDTKVLGVHGFENFIAIIRGKVDRSLSLCPSGKASISSQAKLL